MSLANLRWEQDLQVSERNYGDEAGPLCILLQHLKGTHRLYRLVRQST